MPSSRITLTAETQSDDIRYSLPQVTADFSQETVDFPQEIAGFPQETAENKMAICTGIPFSSFKSGGWRALEKNCVWKGVVGAKLFADRTSGSGCPQPAANHNLAICTGSLFERLKRHRGMSKAENSWLRMVHLSC